MDDYRLPDVLMVPFAVQIVRTYLAPFRKESGGNRLCSGAVWIIYVLFQYLVMASGAGFPLLVFFIHILLVTLIQTFSCSGDFRTALFRSGVFHASWMAVEVITQNILLSAGTGGEAFFTAGNILSKTAMYIAVLLYGRWKSRGDSFPIPFRHWAELFLVPVSSVFIIYSAYMFTLRSGTHAVFTAISVLMILVDCIIFDVYEKMGAQALMERQNQIYGQGIRLCVRQAAEREEAYRRTRILRHDLNDRLVAVGALLEAGDTEGALSGIRRMLGENRLLGQEAARSGNIALDALVNYKYSAALAEGAALECRMEVPAALPVDGMDLCVILGNLLDNALEAVGMLPEGERRIGLTVRLTKGVLFILVENPYAGEISVDGKGRIHSGKTGEHGIGLWSVERTAAKYGGEVSVRHDGGMFRVSVMLCAGKSYTESGVFD